MMTNGWIKLHRKMLEWEWYDHPTVSRIFIHCLLKANREEKQWRGKTILPGQLITSASKLGKELGLSRQQIRTGLATIQSTSEITIEATNNYTLITITNWQSHQQTNQPDNHPLNHRITTNKKDKKKRKEEYIGIPDWIDGGLWDEFLDIRKKKKAVNSPRALKAIINKLEKWKQQGLDPNKVVERSVVNSWKDVFVDQHLAKQQEKSNVKTF